jgi:hypothetical protein
MRIALLLFAGILSVLPLRLEAQRNCTKGIPCGGSCIAATKTCHVGTAGAAAPPAATGPTAAPRAVAAPQAATSMDAGGRWIADPFLKNAYPMACPNGQSLASDAARARRTPRTFASREAVVAAGYAAIEAGCPTAIPAVDLTAPSSAYAAQPLTAEWLGDPAIKVVFSRRCPNGQAAEQRAVAESLPIVLFTSSQSAAAAGYTVVTAGCPAGVR